MNIDLMPAAHGDCLWVEYGDPVRRVLIDGGHKSTYEDLRERIASLPEAERVFELLVVTHIDGDHIEGAIMLLNDPSLKVTIKQVWFNGWEHLPVVLPVSFGSKQGEYLSGLIRRRRLPWNTDFGGDAVVVPDTGDLPVVEVEGGLKLTLLSPGTDELERLVPAWESEVRKAGLEPGDDAAALQHMEDKARSLIPQPFSTPTGDLDEFAAAPYSKDGSRANAASIAFLAEADGQSALLAGDALSERLEASLERLAAARGVDRVAVDAFKLPHHGSRANLAPSLLGQLDCKDFLVSTNGSLFGHPDPEAIARIVKAVPGATFHFNYRVETTEYFEYASWQTKHGYSVRFPPNGEIGIRYPSGRWVIVRKTQGLLDWINKASAARLSQLDSVGPKLGQAIFEDREAFGAYKRLSDMSRVDGIGPVTLAAIRDSRPRGVVGQPAPAREPEASPGQ